MKKLLLPPLCILYALGCRAQASADSVYTRLDTMPLFAGCPLEGQSLTSAKTCSDQQLIEFISRQLQYPEAARQKGTEGIVYVSFVVTAGGKVAQARLFNDIGDGCGEAALEVLHRMPDWQPGLMNGAPANVRLNLPIQFRLQDAENERASQLLLLWGTVNKSEVSTEELKACLGSPLLVRAPDGASLPLVELAFYYESARGKRQAAMSRGSISPRQAALVRKARKGGTLSVTATVQEHGKFLNISRSFKIY
ncbi:MAG: hypothetical protein RI973_1986 [Bacteroidota bacterium]|jgi:TonB family protein